MNDNEAMIQDCLKRANKLNEWEHNFINALSEDADLNSLSARQEDLLEKIWERVT